VTRPERPADMPLDLYEAWCRSLQLQEQRLADPASEWERDPVTGRIMWKRGKAPWQLRQALN
jgi:hypothetical protein